MMQETIGTLDLKITRLENNLKVLKQQQQLSRLYPDHHRKLQQAEQQVRVQLNQLIQHREQLKLGHMTVH